MRVLTRERMFVLPGGGDGGVGTGVLELLIDVVGAGVLELLLGGGGGVGGGEE